MFIFIVFPDLDLHLTFNHEPFKLHLAF